jgi:hypothetical protein
MPNSIRTPSEGTHATSRRIAEAVDNEAWQRFRVSMKGKSTSEKLDMLEAYYDNQVDENNLVADDIEDVKLRIDNYIKALCRGGQLEAGMTFEHFNDGCIRNHIRK